MKCGVTITQVWPKQLHARNTHDDVMGPEPIAVRRQQAARTVLLLFQEPFLSRQVRVRSVSQETLECWYTCKKHQRQTQGKHAPLTAQGAHPAQGSSETTPDRQASPQPVTSGSCGHFCEHPAIT